MGLYFNIVSFILISNILIILYLVLKNQGVKKYIIIAILVFILFFSYTKFLEHKYNNSFINQGKQNVVVKIISDKEKGDYYNKYVGKVKSDINKNSKILIYVKNEEAFKYGDILKISGEISKPSKASNDKGFDYSNYLKQKKISGIITLEEYKKIAVENDIISYIYKIKEICLKRINKMYKNEEIGFLNAILFGKTSDLDDNIREKFKLTNLSHVLAISGMHISYIILGVERVLEKIIKNIKIKNFLIIIFLIIFIPFVGASPSVVRTCIMNIIAYTAKILLKKDDFYSSFCIALLAILGINPYNLTSISMWLSFGGSIGIVAFSKFLNRVFIKKLNINSKKIQKIIEISIVSISAQIVICPIMLYYFNTISLTFWISNVLISGLISPILILGYMSVILYPMGVIFVFAEKILIKFLFIIIQICTKIPFNQIFLPTPKLYFIIIYYGIICAVIYKFSKNKFYYLKVILNQKYFQNFINKHIKLIKIFFIICLIFILVINIIKYIPNNLRINFLDVGQGDCTLVRTSRNKTVLIDAGEGNADKYDCGENVVFPYLLDHGIMKIDYMIISHFDSDHARWNVLYFRKYESKTYYYRKAGRRI